MVIKMKKTTKYILISIGVLVLLIGSLFAIDLIELPEVEDTTVYSTAAETVSIFDYSEADIVSFSIDNNVGGLEVIQEETTEDDVTTYTYVMVGYENYTAENALGVGMTSMMSLTATKEIGVVDTLSNYGLDNDDTVTVEFTVESGKTETLLIGYDGGETSGKYILYDGIVYIATINTVFFETYTDCVPVYFYDDATYDSTGTAEAVSIEYLYFSGTNFPLEVKVDYFEDEGAYYLTEPIQNVYPSLTLLETLAEYLPALVTSSVAGMNVTEEELVEYGLDEAMIIFEYSLNTVEHKIYLSAKNSDGYHYIMFSDDMNTVYTISAESVETWSYLTINDVRNTYVFLPAISSIETMTFTIDGQDSVIELSREINEDNTTENVTAYDYFTELDGVSTDYTNVTSFYYDVLNISVLDFSTDGTPEYVDEAIVSFEFEFYDGQTYTLEYYQTVDAENRYVAFIDGVYTGTVRSSNITTLLASYQTLLETIE